jgi:hypothetical protein
MVRPFVAHELIQRTARELIAKTAKIEEFVCGALPELASFNVVVRATTAAAVTILRSTSTTIDSAGAVLVFFHENTLMAAILPFIIASL